MEEPEILTDAKTGVDDSMFQLEKNASKTLKNEKWTFLQTSIGTSSVHAVSQVGQAKTKQRKLFWLLVLIICICGCVYEVNSFLLIFLQYPVLIDVEVENNGALEFPAVTVCNLNKMKSYNEDCVKENKSWFECMSEATVYTRTLVLSERKTHTSISETTTNLEKNYKRHSQEFLNHFTSLDDTSRNCYGYRVHDLVMQCSLESKNCNHRNFTYFQSMQYGNCYTFNRNTGTERYPLKVFKVGPSSGLELVLNIDFSSYLNITPSAGLRVVIHSPDEDPNPVEDGINISPGYETQVSLTKTSVKRLPAPYRDRCREYYRLINDTEHVIGSQLDCIRECMQNTSQEKCGCVDPFMETIADHNQCNLKDTTQMSCLDKVLEDMTQIGLPCECPLPCLSTTYDPKISTAVLHPSAADTYYSSFGWASEPRCDLFRFMGLDFISPATDRKKRSQGNGQLESMAKLKVFYESLDHAIYAQRAMFSDSELYAHLGGHLGIWLGLSLVALFEYADYILLLLHLFVQKNNRVT